MKAIKNQIPNFITGLNLFSGCLSLVFAFDGELEKAFYLMVLAAVFDFFDGFAARLLNAKSDIGKELDSLADVVSFGVAPAAIMFVFFKNTVSDCSNLSLLPFIAFIIPVFSAFRLAKFNLDTRQTESFLGLPTPASAMFVGSFVFLPNVFNIAHHPITLCLIIIIMSLLLLTELPMFSLKIKNYKLKDNIDRYVFVALFIPLPFLIPHLWLGSLGIAIYIAINFFSFLIRDFKKTPTSSLFL
jgi:CDP-diacylglycerol--serine O-phosphatidyltransferase